MEGQAGTVLPWWKCLPQCAGCQLLLLQWLNAGCGGCCLWGCHPGSANLHSASSTMVAVLVKISHFLQQSLMWSQTSLVPVASQFVPAVGVGGLRALPTHREFLWLLREIFLYCPICCLKVLRSIIWLDAPIREQGCAASQPNRLLFENCWEELLEKLVPCSYSCIVLQAVWNSFWLQKQMSEFCIDVLKWHPIFWILDCHEVTLSWCWYCRGAVVAAIKKNTCELSAICEQFLKHSFGSYPIDLHYL